MSDIWKLAEAKFDNQFGAGKWHCDDITEPPCVVRFLDMARSPGHGIGRQIVKLFATYNGKRVRVTMASRFGDVGITEDLTAEYGYSKRVFLPELEDFSDTP